MNVERLTETGSRLGRHLARVQADLRQADRLRGSHRETILRVAARQFMQAGFHDLAKDVRRRAREVQK